VSAEAVQSLRQVVRDIVAKEGPAGLFKGAMPSILKAAPSAAVTFAAYEFFLHWLTTNQAAAAAAAAGEDSSSTPRRPLH
jgi:solute carrier family 25 thiamine pyrophosphate transporter 19